MWWGGGHTIQPTRGLTACWMIAEACLTLLSQPAALSDKERDIAECQKGLGKVEQLSLHRLMFCRGFCRPLTWSICSHLLRFSDSKKMAGYVSFSLKTIQLLQDDGITCLNGNTIHTVKPLFVPLIKCTGVCGLQVRPEMESWLHSLFLWDLRQVSGHSEPWLPHLQNGPLGLQGYCEASSLMPGPQEVFTNAWLFSCLHRHSRTNTERDHPDSHNEEGRKQLDIQQVPISPQGVDM